MSGGDITHYFKEFIVCEVSEDFTYHYLSSFKTENFVSDS
jgi:hypothetical protein